jgi:hypothetical protein
MIRQRWTYSCATEHMVFGVSRDDMYEFGCRIPSRLYCSIYFHFILQVIGISRRPISTGKEGNFILIQISEEMLITFCHFSWTDRRQGFYDNSEPEHIARWLWFDRDVSSDLVSGDLCKWILVRFQWIKDDSRADRRTIGSLHQTKDFGMESSSQFRSSCILLHQMARTEMLQSWDLNSNTWPKITPGC